MLKPIPSAPDYYADVEGNIWSKNPGRWGRFVGKPRKRKLWPEKDGYLGVVLSIAGEDGIKRPKNKRVATLVAEAFHGPRPEGLSIAHLNGIKTDNRPQNLAYATYREQALHKEIHGTMVRGDRSRLSKYPDSVWREILRRLGDGESQASLSREFGPSLSAIHSVKTGKVRKHLTGDPVADYAEFN